MISRYARGFMYWANMPEGVWNDAKNNKQRPVIIVSNNTNNQFSNSILVVPCTSNDNKTDLPTHYTTKLYSEGTTVVLCENLTNIPKSSLTGFIGMLDPEEMKEVDEKIKIAVGLSEIPEEKPQPQMLIKEDGVFKPSNSSEDQKSDEKKHSTATLSTDYKKQFIDDYEQFGVDHVVTKYKVASRIAAYQRVAYYKNCLKNPK